MRVLGRPKPDPVEKAIRWCCKLCERWNLGHWVRCWNCGAARPW